MQHSPYKRPGDVLDYTVDWTSWLNGDTIATATFTVGASSELAITQEQVTPQTAVVWLSGGKKGKHKVNCRIVTAQGRTKNQPIKIEVID